MKKSIISVFVIAAAAIALVSCNKEVPQNNEAPLQKASTVSFVASQPDTKAAFGTQSGSTLPTLWTSNDKEAATVLNYTSWKKTSITPSSDGKTAHFDSAIADDGTGEYTFYLVSPLAAFYGYTDSLELQDGSIVPVLAYEIPSVQTSGANSPDENAMVLLAYTDKMTAWPTEPLDVTFHHMTAYLKLDLQNLDLDEGEEVESVVISSESYLSGLMGVDVEDGMGILVNPTTSIVVNTNGNNPVWVACEPLAAGTVLTITAKTNAKYEYEVEYTTPAALNAGTVAQAVIDYDGIMGSEVLFSYDDWLGTFTIDRYADGSQMDEITISQDERGSSYIVDNLADFGVEVPAFYDATTGAIEFVNVDSLFTYESSYGMSNIWFRGWVVSGTNTVPVSGGTYLIATAVLDGNKAELVPEDIELTSGTYTFTQMGFGADITEGQYAGYYLTFSGDPYVYLPTTMTKSSASGAPKTNMLGHERAMEGLEAVLVKDKVLKLK